MGFFDRWFGRLLVQEEGKPGERVSGTDLMKAK